MSDKKTAIITGASQGIGAGLVAAFLKEGYNIVATSRNVSQSLTPHPDWFSLMAISVSGKPPPRLLKRQSDTSEPSMFW